VLAVTMIGVQHIKRLSPVSWPAGCRLGSGLSVVETAVRGDNVGADAEGPLAGTYAK